MPGINVQIRRSGPFLDGDPRAVIRRQMTKAKHDVGEKLVHEIQQRLDRVLVNPTGHYRSQIDYLINQGNGAVVVHDRGVVYGPWLENAGSRAGKTRFRGYNTFRKTFQELQDDVAKMTQEHIKVAVRELS